MGLANSVVSGSNGLSEMLRIDGDAILSMAVFALFAVWIIRGPVGRYNLHMRNIRFAGWVKDADVGMHDPERVRVMKPVLEMQESLDLMVPAGGAVAFYWLVVLPDPQASLKDWYVFIGSLAFFTLGVIGLLRSFTRIMIYPDRIERTHPLQSCFKGGLADIENIQRINNTISKGVWLVFRDGRRMKVRAQMSGYHQLMERLAVSNPDLRLAIDEFRESNHFNGLLRENY